MIKHAYQAGILQALHICGLTKYAKEFAPGIPEERKVQPLPTVKKPEEWTLAVQRHHAARAGEHLDLRLVDRQGQAHSWAIPKARLPKPGDRPVLAIPQPTHTKEYALTGGKDKPLKIESGYGKGTVKMEELGPVEVYHATPQDRTRVRFNRYSGLGPEEFAIVETASGSQLLVNKTKTKERLSHVPLGHKPKMRSLKNPELIDLENDDEVMMPKYDGAHTLLDLEKTDQIPRIYSYRTPRRARAGVIEHTHKVPYLLETRVPKGLAGTVLRTELVGVENNTSKGIPATEIGGMLNATVPRSRALQKDRNAVLLPIALDITRYRGKDMSKTPYEERYRILKDIGVQLGIPVTEAALSSQEKKELLGSIQAGAHPMTNEGVVLRDKHQLPDRVSKFKIRPDHDVYVREIFEATTASGKPTGRAGGFTYSHTPKGAIKGRVGTGFSHALARDMLKNPTRYVGRVAKVEAEKKMPSGALSKPAFLEWHLDKGKQL